MKITITRVDNGYIVETVGEESEVEVVVDSEPHTSRGESIGGMQQLLYTIMDKLGHYGSKHDELRLRIVIEEQHAERDGVIINPDDPSTFAWVKVRE